MIHSRHLLSRRCMSSLTERFRTVNNPGNCLHPITAPKVNSQSFPNVSHFPQGLGPLFNLAPRLQTALEPAMRSEITSKQVEELASFSQAAWGYEAKKETKEKGKDRKKDKQKWDEDSDPDEKPKKKEKPKKDKKDKKGKFDEDY